MLSALAWSCSERSAWYWDKALEKLFEDSREQIAKSVKEITMYNKSR